MGDRTLFGEASEAMCPAEGMSLVESLDPASLQAVRRAGTKTAQFSESLKTPDEPDELGNYYKCIGETSLCPFSQGVARQLRIHLGVLQRLSV